MNAISFVFLNVSYIYANLYFFYVYSPSPVLRGLSLSFSLVMVSSPPPPPPEIIKLFFNYVQNRFLRSGFWYPMLFTCGYRPPSLFSSRTVAPRTRTIHGRSVVQVPHHFFSRHRQTWDLFWMEIERDRAGEKRGSLPSMSFVRKKSKSKSIHGRERIPFLRLACRTNEFVRINLTSTA